MRKLIGVITLLVLPLFAAALSNEEIREMMDKSAPTVGDAVYLIAAMDNPDITRDALATDSSRKLAKMNLDAPLTVGKFGIVALEQKKLKGGLMYAITHGGKYAADVLRHYNLISDKYSWNRKLNGQELFELFAMLKKHISGGEVKPLGGEEETAATDEATDEATEEEISSDAVTNE